jgi:hypothetical protein
VAFGGGGLLEAEIEPGDVGAEAVELALVVLSLGFELHVEAVLLQEVLSADFVDFGLHCGEGRCSFCGDAGLFVGPFLLEAGDAEAVAVDSRGEGDEGGQPEEVADGESHAGILRERPASWWFVADGLLAVDATRRSLRVVRSQRTLGSSDAVPDEDVLAALREQVCSRLRRLAAD